MLEETEAKPRYLYEPQKSEHRHITSEGPHSFASLRTNWHLRSAAMHPSDTKCITILKTQYSSSFKGSNPVRHGKMSKYLLPKTWIVFFFSKQKRGADLFSLVEPSFRMRQASVPSSSVECSSQNKLSLECSSNQTDTNHSNK